MRKRIEYLDGWKKQLVQESLDGGNISFVARKYGISPTTLHKWVREFRDEVEIDMGQDKEISSTIAPKKKDDYKQKYDQAMKLLGEKELEIAILRDLLKKNNPDYRKD